MPTWLFWLALLLQVATLALIWKLWQSRQRPDVRQDAQWLQTLQALGAQLQQVERSAQGVQMAAARSEGALAQIQQQLQMAQQQAQQAAQAGRQEQAGALTALREDLTRLAARVQQGSEQAQGGLQESTRQLGDHVQQRFEALALSLGGTLDSLKNDLRAHQAHASTTLGAALKDQLGQYGEQSRHLFAGLQDAVTQQLQGMARAQQTLGEQLRATLNERLASIQTDNAAKLEQMRQTVDEKLHATLEQRLGESFQLVSRRLEQVHQGLGEMQTLAGSVGDLKRIMGNVKARGTWGEWQLGAIMEEVLTPQQYAHNVKPVPGSNEMVEFAVRLPGQDSADAPLWLPIDAKYPVEDYQRLLEAREGGDRTTVDKAAAAFAGSIRQEAKKIADKYIHPPHTTDFAVLYLPTEGLFAEVARHPGLLEAVQNGCRVMIAGPTTLAALLSSLQMGFRTLAIQKHSSEVWQVLGQVKAEFKKFGEAVDKTRKYLDTATKSLDPLQTRTRAMTRALKQVGEAPPDAPPLLLDDPDDAA